MQATQLSFDFTAHPLHKAKSISNDLAWRDVTDIARCAGFGCACEIRQELYELLSNQALFDTLWTANFTLSLDNSNCAQFTLELEELVIQFKALKTNHVVRLGCVNDF